MRVGEDPNIQHTGGETVRVALGSEPPNLRRRELIASEHLVWDQVLPRPWLIQVTAGDSHRTCDSRSAWPGEAPAPAHLQARGNWAVASSGTERSMVRRLRGRVHARRPALLLPAHHQRLC